MEKTTVLLVNLAQKVKSKKLPSRKIAFLVVFALTFTGFAVKFAPRPVTAVASSRALKVEEKETVLFTLLSVGYRVPESRPQIAAITRQLVERDTSTAVDMGLPAEKLVESRDGLLTFSPNFFKVDPVKQALSLTTAIGIKLSLPEGNPEIAVRPSGE